MRKWIAGTAVLVAVGLAALSIGPNLVDGRMNTVIHTAPYTASESARAAHQALFVADLHDDALLWNRDLLQRYDRDSQGRLIVVQSRQDLVGFISAWSKDNQRVAAILATEGLHPLEGKLENVDRLYDAGFRITGLTHFFDNEVGGSAHGLGKGGLTPFGRQVVARLQDKGMLIDDVLAVATRPVMVSHTGVAGIGYWEGAICKPDIPSIVKVIRYAVDTVGVAHVALGSDFDGGTRTPFDVTGLPQLTEGLMAAGFSAGDIRAIMGGNVQRLLLQTLPAS